MGLQQFLPFLFQQPCPLCRRLSAAELCQDCWQQVQACQVTNPIAFWQSQPRVFAWGSYGGTLKRAITALKYQRQPRLAEPLGRGLAEAWLRARVAESTSLIVVPIPLHGDKLKLRSYNQAELIAINFCRITNLPLQQGLDRTRITSAQAKLSQADRLNNLKGAFSLGKSFLKHPPRYPVLLVDDIYTTGATANSAILTLRKAGIPVYGVATVAIAEKLTVTTVAANLGFNL